MIPGPDLVLGCRRCGFAASVPTLVSGNTFAGRTWTDGKGEYPMLPQAPRASRCGGCGDYFWVRDAKVVGRVGGHRVYWIGRRKNIGRRGRPAILDPAAVPATSEKARRAWLEAPRVRELSEAEALDAVCGGLATNREEEIHLRLGAWRAGNDAFRGRSASTGRRFRRSAAARENLRRLQALLDERQPQERLLLAEAARELGRFGEAARLLAADFPEEFLLAVRKVQALAAKRDRQVRIVATWGGFEPEPVRPRGMPERDPSLR